MKYLKTYESREQQKAAEKLKWKLFRTLYKYLKHFYNVSKIPDSTFITYGSAAVSIGKEREQFNIFFRETATFSDAFELLKEWLNEKGFQDIKIYDLDNDNPVYIPVNKTETFIELIDELIESEDFYTHINAMKYNL